MAIAHHRIGVRRTSRVRNLSPVRREHLGAAATFLNFSQTSFWRQVLMHAESSLLLGTWLCSALIVCVSVPALADTRVMEDLQTALQAPIEARGPGSCPAPEQFFLTRPDPPGAPTLVGLAVLFQDVSSLSDLDQTITADL